MRVRVLGVPYSRRCLSVCVCVCLSVCLSVCLRVVVKNKLPYYILNIYLTTIRASVNFCAENLRRGLNR